MLDDQQVQSKVEEFLAKHAGKRIVLVTSGGTKVPLEKNTVRFIDNFSMGMRGAASTEYFLKAGYAVIFLHREESLRPFSRSLHNLFESLQIQDGKVVCSLEGISTAVNDFTRLKDDICNIPFQTLQQYLHLLEKISSILSSIGSSAIVYLAAAVSDFYVTSEKMPTHKIQSRDGDLNLTLSIVPKTLDRLVHQLVPKAFVVSFKLETDENILIKKARGALQNYGHELVIANLLATRKHHVVLVDNESAKDINLTQEEMAAGEEIERQIVDELSRRHDEFIQAQEK